MQVTVSLTAEMTQFQSLRETVPVAKNVKTHHFVSHINLFNESYFTSGGKITSLVLHDKLLMEKVVFLKYIFTGQFTNLIYLPTTTFTKKWWVFILDAA